jgi:serine O-acetyltransferase
MIGTKCFSYLYYLIKFPFYYFYSGAGYRVKVYVRLIIFFKSRRQMWVARFLSNRLEKIQGVTLSPLADFDKTLDLRHPVGIVIGRDIKIGRNVIIFQNVTIGGRRLGEAKQGKMPWVGDNTVIFAGAVIVGEVSIGKNCVIGANSVVTMDVPDNCMAVGAPARIIKKEKPDDE